MKALSALLHWERTLTRRALAVWGERMGGWRVK